MKVTASASAPRLPRLAPSVILFVAFVLRIINLTGESLWRDEVDTVRFAFESLGEVLNNLTRAGFNGPLYHLIMRAWLSLAGVNDFALRYFSLVCGVLLVALIYVLTKRLFNAHAAIIAMWLAAIAPVLIWYAGEGKMYSLQPMLIVLALYALRRVVDVGRDRDQRLEIGDWKSQSPISNLQSPLWWAVFIISTSLAYYVHLLSPLFVIVALIFFIAWWRESRQHIMGGLIALALLTLPYLPLAVWQVPQLIQGGNIGHVFYPLDQMAFVLVTDWSLGLDSRTPLFNLHASGPLLEWVRWGCMALFLIVALAGAARELRHPRCGTHSALPMLAWLVLPTVLVYLVSTRVPIFQPRYMLWSAPALYVLAGVGLTGEQTIDDRRQTAIVGYLSSIALIIVSAISLLGVLAQIINPIRPDLRGAVTFMIKEMQPGDIFVFQIPYARHSFAYYVGQFAPSEVNDLSSHIVEAPFTNYPDTTERDVARQLEFLRTQPNRIWLFETESAMWDARGLVREWFDENLNLIERWNSRGVSLGVYQPQG